MSTLDDVLRVLLAGVEDGQYVIRQGAQFGGTDTIGASSWYDGSGAPSGGLGKNGDYYLDDSTGDVYSKTSGSWDIVANITGATGAVGPAGPAGPSTVITESSGPTNLAVGAIADGQVIQRVSATAVGLTLGTSAILNVGTGSGDVAAGNAPAAAITAHVAAVDPHGDRAFATSADAAVTTAVEAYSDAALAAHVIAADPHGDRAFATAADVTVAATAASALAAHVVAADPHGDRAFATAADATVTTAVEAYSDAALATHVAAANPHVGYQLRSEKDAVSGYVGLSSAKRVVLSGTSGAGQATLKVSAGLHADALVTSTWVASSNYTLFASDSATPDFALYCTGTIAVTLPFVAYASEATAFTGGQLYSINNVGTGTVTLTVPAGDPAVPTLTGGGTTFSLPAGNSVLVQYDKINNIWRIIANTNRWFTATDKLLGRSTAGAGYGEEIALTSVARTLIAQTTQATMRTTGLGLATVASSGSASDLGSGTLPLARLSGITNTEIAAGAAIALSKLATQADATILGNNSGGAGVPLALTATQTKTLLAIAAGDVSGLAAVATSGSASDLGTGTLPLARLANITDTQIAAANKDGLAAVASLRTLGTGAATACAGNDSRLSDSRTASAINLGTATITGALPAANMPALTGDVTTSAGAVATTIAAGVVTLAKQANLAANSFQGNDTGSPATPIALTVAQSKTLLGLVTVATSGLASDLTGTLAAAQMPALTGDVTTSAGAVATSLSAARVNQLLAGLDISARVFESRLSNHATPLLMVSAVAYFVYMGRTTVAITPKFVEFYVSTLGAGTSEVGEVGLFSTPSAPNKAAQSLTKLVSTGTVDTVKVGLGVKRNTSAFATSVPAGTFLWAGIRYAMSGTPTQPTTLSLGYDFAEGQILSLASATALTGTGPFAGAIIAASATQVCPDLRVTLD
jgi:hypothetical protein